VGESITAFMALGAKNYCVLTKPLKPPSHPSLMSLPCEPSTSTNVSLEEQEEEEEDEDIIKSSVHVRGLSLSSRYAKSTVNARTMDEFTDALLSGTPKSVGALQFRLSTVSQSREIQTRYYIKRFSNTHSAKRAILPEAERTSCFLQTMPYGYTKKSLRDMQAYFQNV